LPLKLITCLAIDGALKAKKGLISQEASPHSKLLLAAIVGVEPALGSVDADVGHSCHDDPLAL
jgi:hypothetical protein